MFGFRAAQLLHFRIVSQHVASQSTSMRLRTKMNIMDSAVSVWAAPLLVGKRWATLMSTLQQAAAWGIPHTTLCVATKPQFDVWRLLQCASSRVQEAE